MFSTYLSCVMAEHWWADSERCFLICDVVGWGGEEVAGRDQSHHSRDQLHSWTLNHGKETDSDALIYTEYNAIFGVQYNSTYYVKGMVLVELN